jgi:hypothetical protein
MRGFTRGAVNGAVLTTHARGEAPAVPGCFELSGEPDAVSGSEEGDDGEGYHHQEKSKTPHWFFLLVCLPF